MKRCWDQNPLSPALAMLLPLFWPAQAAVHSQDWQKRKQHPLNWRQVLVTLPAWATTAESWKGKVLQLRASVVFAIDLRQWELAASTLSAEMKRGRPQLGFWQRTPLPLALLDLTATWRPGK